MPKHSGKMLGFARELRKNQTKEERKLWYDFLNKLPAEVRFRRQQIIDSYIVDFYCPAKKLAIEIDGSQHYTEEGEQADKLRDKTLAKNGIAVLRFTNLDINERFENCCKEILKTLGLL